MAGPSGAPLHDVIEDLTNQFKKKFESLPSKHFWLRICKVQDCLRQVNVMAYEPVLVAIGPYHHGNPHLRKMEDLKLRCFKSLLDRTNETDTKRYVEAMMEIEEKARDFYADPITLGRNDFVMMMVIDGCFLVELFTGFYEKMDQPNNIKQPEQDAVDVILGKDWLLRSIQRDLLLCENQIPYFVLSKLFGLAVPIDQDFPYFFAMDFFSAILGGKRMSWLSIMTDTVFETDFDHLVSMVHSYWCPPDARKKHNDRLPNMLEKWIFRFSATELQEAGIKFMRRKSIEHPAAQVKVNNWDLPVVREPPRFVGFEIKFNNGVLEIPFLTIDNHTESLFRNLLAYEQQSQPFTFSYITDYIRFMDILIDTEKDVQILRHKKIIQNGLGDDEAVCAMFNNFCKNLVFESRDSCYFEVLTTMSRHCEKRRHRWMANLRRNYFNSPWALISFLAAAFVILLTAAQTLYAIFSYQISSYL